MKRIIESMGIIISTLCTILSIWGCYVSLVNLIFGLHQSLYLGGTGFSNLTSFSLFCIVMFVLLLIAFILQVVVSLPFKKAKFFCSIKKNKLFLICLSCFEVLGLFITNQFWNNVAKRISLEISFNEFSYTVFKFVLSAGFFVVILSLNTIFKTIQEKAKDDGVEVKE